MGNKYQLKKRCGILKEKGLNKETRAMVIRWTEAEEN